MFEPEWRAQMRAPGRRSFMERAREDPLVPLGCAATALVLLGGLVTFYKGQTRLSNRFMQARVVAQGVTVAALAAGASATTLGIYRPPPKPPTPAFEDRMQIQLRHEDDDRK